jgi:hypothetical protein
MLTRMQWTVHTEKPLYQDQWLDIRVADVRGLPPCPECRVRVPGLAIRSRFLLLAGVSPRCAYPARVPVP